MIQQLTVKELLQFIADVTAAEAAAIGRNSQLMKLIVTDADFIVG